MKDCRVYQGMLVDSREDWSLRIEDGILVVQGDTIIYRGQMGELDEVLEKYGVPREEVHSLSSHQFILPGLIDTHIHASQFPNAGLALDLPLLDWLKKYTFPTEAKFSDLQYSKEVYERCVRSTLDSGTTTAVYFATIHRESSEILADICNRLGQRAFIGKVCMDRESPDYYIETTEQSLAETIEFIKKVEELGGSLVKPILTPRFVPSCSRTLMTNLGALAQERSLPVQTHISENKEEVRWVQGLETDCSSYTQVYQKCGLLGPRTILAHGIYLSDTELEIIRVHGAGISHCPNSNFSLKSGICDVRRLRSKGVKVGLGTDCSGGYSPSLLDSMRLAVVACNALVITRGKEEHTHLTSGGQEEHTSLTNGGQEEHTHLTSEGQEERNHLTISDSIYLATRGGASLLHMEDRLGSLDSEKLADFIVVDLHGQTNSKPFGHESREDLVHKFVFLGDDRNIVQVVVGGQVVKQIIQL